jgi:hypothetical protein
LLRAHLERFLQDHNYQAFLKNIVSPEELVQRFFDWNVKLHFYAGRGHHGIIKLVYTALGFPEEYKPDKKLGTLHVSCRSITMKDAIRWLLTHFPQAKQVSSPLGTAYEIPDTYFRFHEMTGGGIAIETDSNAWETSVDLARDVFRELSCEIICHPGLLRPEDNYDPSIFWTLSQQGEGLRRITFTPGGGWTAAPL